MRMPEALPIFRLHRPYASVASLTLMTLLFTGCSGSPSGTTAASDSSIDSRDHKKKVPGTPPNTVTSSTVPLNPFTQPKFVNVLPIPRVAAPNIAGGFAQYDMSMSEFSQDLGLIDPNTGQAIKTMVWGYGGSYPGPTLETRSTSSENNLNRGMPVKVRWSNQLPNRHLLPLDTTLMCGSAAPGCRPEVRTVTHLHGGHTDAGSDGHPNAWYTANNLQTGPTYDPSLNGMYTYRNDQGATALWYHDHAMAITRLNVYAGLAGMYMIRDDNEDKLRQTQKLPDLRYEIPLMIQDKSFYSDGALRYPRDPFVDPATGAPVTRDPVTGAVVPSIVPEFYGDIILVNGKAWPAMNVEPRRYRLRMVNGSNSRFYDMAFGWTLATAPGVPNVLPFHQIGSDGGLLNRPVQMNSLLLAPGERADVIVDFSNVFVAGQTVIISNSARSPFPAGNPPDPSSTGQIMAFRVVLPLDITVPMTLQPSDHMRSKSIPELKPTPGVLPRELLLAEGVDAYGRIWPRIGTSAAGPLAFHDFVTELPKLGTTEIWSIINTTADTHPVHQHLVQFQVLDRQPFDTLAYVPGQPATLRMIGDQSRPSQNEKGLKDTVQARPGEVIRLIAKYDLLGDYVWHCHILEHEDHDMMRPFRVVL